VLFFIKFNKMRFVALFSLIATTLIAYSQTDLQVNISTKQIVDDIFILASDSLEGRKFPSTGREKAARYIANEFGKVGLKSISLGNEPYFQKIPVKYTDKGATHLKVDDKWISSGNKYSFSSTIPFTDSITLPLKFVGPNMSKNNVEPGDTIFHITAKNIHQAVGMLKDISSSTHSEYFAISLLGKKSTANKLINNERLSVSIQYPVGLFGMGSKDYKWLYSYLPEIGRAHV